MRNATAADVKKAQETGKLEENVMYKVYNMLVHGKNVFVHTQENIRKDYTAVCGGTPCIAETSDGMILVVDTDDLKPVPKGPAQQPKRIKRKPVRGTKPEQLIEMNESVKLKAGDKVLLKNGVRTVVLQDDGSYIPYQIAHQHRWNLLSGVSADAEYREEYAQYNITHKIVPWQEQERYSSNIDPAHSVLKWVEPKSPEQEAFEKGYWVPHSATHSSRCPDSVINCLVEVLLANGISDAAGNGSEWIWTSWTAPGWCIVAYRKAKQQ